MAAESPQTPDKTFTYFDIVKSVWYFMDKHKTQFVVWVSIVFVVRFYQVVPPIFISKITDFFSHYKNGQSLDLFYLLIIGFGISYAATALIRATAKNKVGDLEAEAVYNAKVWGFERLLDFSLKWHDKENTGNKIQKIVNGTTSFRDLRRIVNNDGFEALAAVIGIVVVFAFIKPVFILFVIVYFTVYAIVHMYFNTKLQLVVSQANLAKENASGAYYEGLNNVVTLKTLGAKDSFKESIFATEEQAKIFQKQRNKVAFTKVKTFQVFNGGAISIYLFMVGLGVIDKSISVGTIFVFYSYLIRIIEAAWEGAEVLESLVDVRSAIARMMPIYLEDQKIKFGTKQFPNTWQSVHIDKGTFSHTNSSTTEEDEVFTITDLDFSINKFEKVGIVGQSGSGKSTLAKILLGLYELEKGEFKVDSTSFYDIKHSEITRNIAIVLQDSEMFNLSLKDNITLLKENSNGLLELSIKISQLEELIKRLPDGMETLIGEKGYRLSGGERQRIGIARAIFKNPQIFVFDEATSSLDSKTESLIQEALEKELHKKTIITIAHRLSTLKSVDRIYVFEHGNIIEEGKYDSLMNDPSSKFHQLHTFQSKQLGT